MAHHPGEGTIRCAGKSRGGQPCKNAEIEGLEYCLHHVPDEYLDEAEEITGFRRCRVRSGQPDACTYYAVAGSSPPRCKNHGANRGSVLAKRAAGNVVEARAAGRLAEIMAENGDLLLNPPPIGDPLAAHLRLADEAWALKDIFAKVITWLMSQDRIRYAHSKVGEQLRVELLLYERSVERLDKILTSVNRGGIQRLQLQISQSRIARMERALTAALNAARIPPDRQETARQVLARELARDEDDAA